MEKRWFAFLLICLTAVTLNALLTQWLAPPKPVKPPANVAENDAVEKKKSAEPVLPEKAKAPTGTEVKPGEQTAEAGPVSPTALDVIRTLGSADPKSPYRMLVTFTNRGAAVERVELNSPRYRALDEPFHHNGPPGYLGYLHEVDVPNRGGCKVQIVGPGTPAHFAGLKPDDVIRKAGIDQLVPISNSAEFLGLLNASKPGQPLKLEIARDGAVKTLEIVLGHRPLQMLSPEDPDHLSFLLTLVTPGSPDEASEPKELPKLPLIHGQWTVLPATNADEVAFQMDLPEQGLQVIKRYRLAQVPAEEQDNLDFPGYHLDLKIELKNVGANDNNVAYRLDGPTGLPCEGWWYASSSKISPNWWDSAGLRDVVLKFGGQLQPRLVSCDKITSEKDPVRDVNMPDPTSLEYVGVDTQYFAAVLIPQRKDAADMPMGNPRMLPVGLIPKDKREHKLTNVTCRLHSQPSAPLAAGKLLVHDYRIFVGPKKPTLLGAYAQAAPWDESRSFDLGGLIYYGWPIFAAVSRPMLAVLHFFHDGASVIPGVGNYGLAIIMLTVLVRCCMFPLSRKQAIFTQKMQELQPEMKKIADKYKNDLQARSKAQQEFMKKNNMNQFAGCLPMFVQLPIFIGLYRSLAIDVELRQAPLLGDAIRWCSNLAAPDMLYFWQPWLPEFFSGDTTGWLGPYLNFLPLITIGLMIWQQKMFMPPPADEQAAMQQKMMKYMMIFMGVMFFKVASGLCIYFIASSVWGMTERKLLPKTIKSGTTKEPASRTLVAAGANGNPSAGGKKKQRGRK